MIRPALGLAAALLLAACNAEHTPIRRAAYHWRSVYDPGEQEREWLHRNQIQRIYLRLFDIDWDENLQEPVPVGDVQLPEMPPLEGVEIAPTFFLTNRTFQQIQDSQIDSLSARLIRKARAKLGSMKTPEWQFDCDWTEGTRNAYFRFLRLAGEELQKEGVEVSATIRLHQVKYYLRTGVPPVGRGMLMFYNMGDVQDPAESNSILNLETARNYYHNFDAYPLPLDLALPLWQWGVVFRDEKMTRLINGLAPADLQDAERFSFSGPARATVKKSTYLDGYYLYEGDEIRLEGVSPALLQAAARDLKKIIARRPGWVSLYHLSPETIKLSAHEDLENMFRILER
jgi:hypothetical protein